MNSIPVSYSKSVSIVAQSCAIDKVYLINGGWGEEFHRVMHYSENLSIKYHDQNFYIKTAFSGPHWTEQTIDECKKVSFWGI